MKIIGICYYLSVLKEEKKKHKYTTHKTFHKRPIDHQTKHQLQHNISWYVNFWNSRNWVGPLNDENELEVDEKNNTNWQIWRMYVIVNFTNIRYKLTALSNIIHLIVKYKFMRPVSNLRLHKEKRQQQKIQNNWVRKVSKPLGKWNFRRNISVFN